MRRSKAPSVTSWPAPADFANRSDGASPAYHKRSCQAPTASRRDNALIALMRDFDYRVEGSLLISNGLPGFSSDSTVCHVSSIFDAAERLCPLVGSDEYTRRFVRLTSAPSVHDPAGATE